MSENRPGGIRRFGSVDTVKLVYLAVFTALVAVLQIVSNISGAVLFVPITLTLVPVVMSCALCGKWSGAWLGFVFAITVLFSGAAGFFFVAMPFATSVVVIVKGVAAGVAAGLVYSILENKNRYVAIIASGAAAPIVNTGIFLLASFTIFRDFLLGYAEGEALFAFVLTTFVGVNFPIEIGVNMILAPVIFRMINLKKK